jgi:methylphosphotriester-DNA--protein-cysteine methyltransferase
MRIDRQSPDPRLGAVVDEYETRTMDLRAGSLRIPLPARPQVILDFYLTTPHLIEIQKSGEREPAPWAVVVGPQTFRRVDLLLSGRVEVFTVHFRPTGLHRLLRTSMDCLTNVAVAAEHLFPRREVDELHQRLHVAPSLAHRAAIMDAALLARLEPAPHDIFAAAAERLRATHGAAPLRDLAVESGLSPRQFRRAFKARVGVSPKLYSRILRLNAAIDEKRARPATSWTQIAHQFGWFDQAHLDKDFVDLAGASPHDFFRPAPV